MAVAETTGTVLEAEPSKPESRSEGCHYCSMSSEELLRHGLNLKYLSSLLRGHAIETLTEELGEVRAEWQKRFPEIPLRDTF